MVAALVLASCGPAEEEEEEVTPPPVAEEEEEVPPAEEEEEEVAPTPEGPRYGGVFVYALTTEPLAFDNAIRHISVAPSLHITNETLFRGDWTKGPAGTGEAGWLYCMFPGRDLLAGSLAESYEVPDPDTLVFHIRKGIYWHDKPPTNGREMTAEDVYRTLDHLMHTATSVYYNDDTKYFESFDSITMPDKWTIVMKCLPGQIGPVFERYIHFMRVFPADALDTYGNMGDWRNSIGTGPWMLVDYVPASSLTYARNPNYWMNDPFRPENQLPYLDSVKALVIPDVSTRMSAIRTAKLDQLSPLVWDEAESLIKTNPELEYFSYFAGSCWALHWRVDKPELPWHDLKVRQALYMAVNQQSIVGEYYGGNAEILAYPVAPIPEHMYLYTPVEELPESTRELFEYHPEKAKQLLAEAGYPDGFKCEVITYTAYVDVLSIIKANWADVGVDLEINVKEYGTYISILYSRTYDMIMGGYGSTFPFSFYYAVPKQAWNFCEIDDPRINEAYDVITENYFDDDLRTGVAKEIYPYMLDQANELLLPGAYVYNFWQP